MIRMVLLIVGMTTLTLHAETVRLGSGVSGHIHPAFCITPKGTLIAIYSQRDYQDLRLTRSTDGGKTWSPSTEFIHTAKQSFYPGSLTTLSDGRVLHAWNVWYPDGKGDKSRFVQFSTSDDEGKSWSERRSLPKNAKMHSVIRHPIVELSPTEWLFPLMDQTIVYDPKSEKLTPFGDGRLHGLVPIVRTSKGTIVSGAGLRSTDNGKTWEKIAPFPKVGADGWRYDMVALPNGWLVASEVLGPGIGGDKWRFIVSRDDGKTWDFEHPYEFYNPGRPIGGRACPKTIMIDKENIGTLFYDTDAKQEMGSGVFFLRTPIEKLTARKE